ncbi:hypothetical protein B296_00011422 [Ensete ventricosum]|uniref:F-box domain-containing protein n=1 Tax=Ensete ventricosum TaxID=4639 RepID=A0A427AG89_ENSVE|nr:hypothetical protein B296_00011422 [Ensete ventricosum]
MPRDVLVSVRWLLCSFDSWTADESAGPALDGRALSLLLPFPVDRRRSHRPVLHLRPLGPPIERRRGLPEAQEEEALRLLLLLRGSRESWGWGLRGVFRRPRRKKRCGCSCSCGVPGSPGGGDCDARSGDGDMAVRDNKVGTAERQAGGSMMEQLVPEITTHALSYLDYTSLCRLSMTNSAMRRAANDDGAWKALYHKVSPPAASFLIWTVARCCTLRSIC